MPTAQRLEVVSISKSFPGVRALQDVSLAVRPGSVHALIGENGAGKSTLLKLLSGAYRPDSGSILLDGQPHVFRNTAQALQDGVAVIYQELQLVGQLSVEQNLFLGHLPRKLGIVRRRALREKARAQLEALGEKIDPSTLVDRLPIAQRQMVEIAKALTHQARVIAFDEPTSSISTQETRRLFDVIRRLKREGKAVLYVSHRMDEIEELCDAASVLRDGKHVESFDSLAGVTREMLVQKMVGRSITDIFGYVPRETGSERFRVEGVYGPGIPAPVSFSVKSGEIYGLFGLVGAGRTELLKLLSGATRSRGGRVQLDGANLDLSSPRAAIRQGVVLCVEDRKKEGIIGIRSVQENINISGRRHFSPLGLFISPGRERSNAQQFVDQLKVRTPTVQQPIGTLSGGNQQKAILARWLSEQPKVILLDEPTRGIDVGAKSEIYRIMYALAAQGVALVVVSSELPEVLGVCDRIGVMRGGQIVSTFDRTDATQERLLQNALPAASHEVGVPASS